MMLKCWMMLGCWMMLRRVILLWVMLLWVMFRVSNGVLWDPVKRDGIWIPIWDIPRGPVPSQIGTVY
jgi:hypothetical protein